MHIARTAAEARSAAGSLERPLGYVPTMGALHAGHLSLVAAARGRARSLVVSIFVNPLQFGPGEDFDRYPRAFAADCAQLAALGVDLVYAPGPAEVYPPGFAAHVDAGPLGTVFEGARRPGHFNGVATVMTKLLNTLRPNLFVMGQKDAQQVAVLRRVSTDLDLGAEMVVAPTVREADGLALSSRNVYLDASRRAAAPSLYAALRAVADAIAGGERDPRRALSAGRPLLDPRLTEYYLAIVDPLTFAEPAQAQRGALAIGAVLAGTTRLIDNVEAG